LQQLRSVLLHELGHVVQRDAWGNLLFCLAFPLLYWHPLYWLLRSRARLAAELVADDWAAQHTGKEAYVEQLVALAGSLGSGSIRLLGATGVVSSPSQFYRRMEMLLKRETQLATTPSAAWRCTMLGSSAAIVVLAALLAGVRPTPAVAQDQPSNTPTAETPTDPNSKSQPIVERTSEAADPTAPKEQIANGEAKAKEEVRRAQLAAIDAKVAEQLKQLELEKQELIWEIKKLRDELDQREPGKGAYPKPKQVQVLDTELNLIKQKIEENERALANAAKLDLAPAQREHRQAELDKYREMERQLTARLEGVKANYPSSREAGVPVLKDIPILGQLFTNDNKRGIVVRGDGTANAHVELWRTIADGSKKVVETRVTELEGPVADVAIQNDNRTDGFIVEYRLKGGQRHLTIYSTKGADEPNTFSSTRESKPFIGASRRESGDDLGGLKASREIDLINLATSYADAIAALESSESKLAELEPLAKSNAVAQFEVTTARTNLSAAKRKESLLRRITEVAAKSAAQEYERTKELTERGVVPAGAAADAEAKYRILHEILSTRPSEPTPTKETVPASK
jgi:hypothetical protein